MSRINLNTRVSLKQAKAAIAAIGAQRTILLQGEPGIGKSWLIKELAAEFPTHRPVYIDCQLLLDQGDFFYPFIADTDGGKIAERVMLEDFNFNSEQPLIIMLDEIGKANKAVMNVLLTLMYDRRIGSVPAPEGSMVFATTNLSTDGVGDFVAAHARSRVIRVEVAKPHAGFNPDSTVDPDSWGHWALGNDIAPALIAWVKSKPECLDSYRNYTAGEKWGNPYAFHPTQGAESYVCPRSLHAASDVVKQRDVLGHELTLSLLAGAAGEAFARDFSAWLLVKDRVASMDAVVASPESAAVPENHDAVALCVMVFSLVAATTDKTIVPFTTYMQRLPKEYQAMYSRSVMASEAKQKVAIACEKFRKWAMDNHWMF
jgi:hypothetical protein